MPHYELGKVFVQWELILRRGSGKESPVYIRVGQPFYSKEHDVWQCPYEVEVDGKKNTFAVYGIDTVQALVATLKTIDVELSVRAKQIPGEFIWFGKPHTTLFDPVDHVRNK
jgi:hypothetical protein